MFQKVLFAIGYIIFFIIVITAVGTALLVGSNFIYDLLFPQPSQIAMSFKIIYVIISSLLFFVAIVFTGSVLLMVLKYADAWFFSPPAHLTLVELTEKSFLKQHLREMIREFEKLGFSLDKYYRTKEYHYFLANLVKNDEGISAVVYCRFGGESEPNYYWMELTIYLADGIRVMVSNAPDIINGKERPIPPFKKIIYVNNKTTASELLEIMRRMAENIFTPLLCQIHFKDQYEADAAREIAWLVETYGDSIKARLRRKMFIDFGGL